MNPSSPRSIDDYLHALRAALAGADPALIQDALYDAEEHLRAEAAANPGKSEAELLEHVARTYGAPDEVAAAYRDTEAKVNAALQPPVSRRVQSPNLLSRFFSVYSDPRAYVSLFFMFLSLVTGMCLFHLRRDRSVALTRARHSDHRTARVPRVHRHHTRHFPG